MPIKPYGAEPARDVIAFCQHHRLGFCEGNIIKYLVRYQVKGGINDLRQAREYLDRLIVSQIAPPVDNTIWLGADGPADGGAA